jgi:hypothetical protein
MAKTWKQIISRGRYIHWGDNVFIGKGPRGYSVEKKVKINKQAVAEYRPVYGENGGGKNAYTGAIILGNTKNLPLNIKRENRNQYDARVHDNGMKLKSRRSYKHIERILPGAGKTRDEAHYTARTISHESLHHALNRIKEEEASHKLDKVYAHDGYHGIVKKPTRLIVGEGGERERVDITPVKKIHPINHKPQFGIKRININMPDMGFRM